MTEQPDDQMDQIDETDETDQIDHIRTSRGLEVRGGGDFSSLSMEYKCCPVEGVGVAGPYLLLGQSQGI